jgi:hypothetical protein
VAKCFVHPSSTTSSDLLVYQRVVEGGSGQHKKTKALLQARSTIKEKRFEGELSKGLQCFIVQLFQSL